MEEHSPPKNTKIGWQRIETTYPFTTPWLVVRQDRLQSATRGEMVYTYVENNGAILVVPITTDGQVLLIREYRYPVDDWLLAIPAGGLHDQQGVALEEVARQELQEEAGATCGELHYISSFYATPGSSDELFHLYLAFDTEITGPQRNYDAERIEICITPLATALQLARDGKINAGPSALSLLLCENMLKERGYI